MSKKSFDIVNGTHSPMATIFILAWPIFLEQLLVSLVQAVDTAMVGSLGAVSTAAVAINSSTNMLINAVTMALGVGFTALVARSVGAKDFERARGLLRLSLIIVTAVGLVISAFIFINARNIPYWMGGEEEILDLSETYNKIIAPSMVFQSVAMVLTAIYRGYGDSKTPMLTNVLVNALNVVGNYLMIYPSREISIFGNEFNMFGFGWGVAGAALSTTISRILGCVIMIIVCFKRKGDMQISIHDNFIPDKEELKSVIKISLPAMLERFTMGVAFVIVGHTVAYLGTAAVAAQNLAGNAESISFMPGFAFGSAATTLFGQSIGAKREDLGKKFVTKTIFAGSILMAVMSVVLFAGSDSIMRLFTPDEVVISMGGELLRILALIQIPQMVSSVYSGALRGAGDSKSPFLIALISMWGVRILGSLVCVHLLHMGLSSICISMCTDNVVRCTLFFLRYRQSPWRKLKDI